MAYSLWLFIISFFVVATQLARADFDIYRVDDLHISGDKDKGSTWYHHWRVMNPWKFGHCDDFHKAKFPGDSNDVSHGRIGVRCVGEGCHGDEPASSIQVLETKFSNHPYLHWTIYKDDRYRMYGIDGKSLGWCEDKSSKIARGQADQIESDVQDENNFICHDHPGDPPYGMTMWIHRKFRCYTEITAELINSSK